MPKHRRLVRQTGTNTIEYYATAKKKKKKKDTLYELLWNDFQMVSEK